MNEVFRISQATLRRRQWSLSAVPLAVLAIVAFGFRRGADDPLTVAVVAATMVTIAIFVARSQYKQFAAFSAHHSMELKQDALLLRTGDVQTRIPYQSIARVTVIGSLRSPRVVTLKLADGSKETLHGYGDMPRLVDHLLQKSPAARLRVNRWVHV